MTYSWQHVHTVESKMFVILMQQGPSGQMWYGDGHMVGMHWGWWIFWIAVVAFLIWLVVRATGARPTDGGPSSPSRQSPEQILRERFGKGEISEEEFRKRLRIIRESEEGGT